MDPDNTPECQCLDFDPREGHQPGCPKRCPLRDHVPDEGERRLFSMDQMRDQLSD